MSQKRSPAQRRYEAGVTLDRMTIAEQNAWLRAGNWLYIRKILRWPARLATITAVMTLLSLAGMGGRAEALPLAVVNGYLSATILMTAHYYLARGIKLYARKNYSPPAA